MRPSAAALAAALCAAPQAAAQGTAPWVNPDCDPAVQGALERAAQEGADQDTSAVRDIVRDTESIFDLSCLDFDFRAHDLLYDPHAALRDLINRARNEICRAGREAYSRYYSRPYADIRGEARRRVPGARTPPAPRDRPPVLRTPGRSPRPPEAGQDDGSRYRDIFGPR